MSLSYIHISHMNMQTCIHTQKHEYTSTHNFLKECVKENMPNIHIEMYKILKI